MHDLAQGLLNAVDPDSIAAAAQAASGDSAPTDTQLTAAAEQLAEAAVAPFHQAELRNTLIAIQQRDEMVVDSVSRDVIRESGFSTSSSEKARGTVDSFRAYIEQH